MELQLGLAPSIHNPVVFKGFDLNYGWFDPKPIKDVGKEKNVTKKKRCFSEAFDETNEDDVKPILCLPLLSWNDEPNEENDDMEHKKRASYKNDEVENNIVGWPPIQSWRKKTLFMNNNQQQTRRIQTPTTTTNTNHVDRSSSSKSKYVKVNMEGFSIGRKIDLKNYHSYETLLKALICLFNISYDQEGYKECKSCVLTYQDKEGDWLLAGDVPWTCFIDTVQRLEISVKGTIAPGSSHV